MNNHLDNLKDWISEKVHEVSEMRVTGVEFRNEPLGKTCLIFHTKGGAAGTASTYTGAATNALNLALNVLPRANSDRSYLLHEAPES